MPQPTRTRRTTRVSDALWVAFSIGGGIFMSFLMFNGLINGAA